MSRVLVSFSCGAASAVAAKMAVDKYGDRVEIIYCDTLKYEHPDNIRFLNDVSAWVGKPKIISSPKYKDIFDDAGQGAPFQKQMQDLRGIASNLNRKNNIFAKNANSIINGGSSMAGPEKIGCVQYA